MADNLADLTTAVDALTAQVAAITPTAPPVSQQPEIDALTGKVTAVSNELAAKFPPTP